MSVTETRGASKGENGMSGRPGPESLWQGVEQLARFVEESVQDGTAAHMVEKGIWEHLLGLGRMALDHFFDQVGNGDLGQEVSLPDGGVLRRLPFPYPRPYQSIFGPFEISRTVYGSREGQKIGWVPLDQRLDLPESKFSYLLQDWDQHLVVETPYAGVSRTLERILGFSQSVDSLERMSRKMAASVVDFLDTLPPPAMAEEGELMVLSADGKGVPIRRQAEKGPITAAPSSGPRPGAKKMALLGVSYSVDRNPRTPEEVLRALFRMPRAEDLPVSRPSPQHKRLRASLERCEDGGTEPATAEIFGWLDSERAARNPDATKPLIVLMDGQRSLWDAAATYFPETSIEILDLLHVTPRLWDAAYLFHPKTGPSAAQFVRQRTLRILNGQSRAVVIGLRRMGTVSGLSGRKRKKLERICRYLENNAHRMHYDRYLEAGYPIATGVIEGACRHLAKDRLERTAMHWVLEGAQAVLDLRSVHLSDQWEEFQKYRIANDNARHDPRGKAFLDAVEWPIAA